MHKYQPNDHVRITDPSSPLFDTTADIWAVVSGVREFLYIVHAHTNPQVVKEAHLILAERPAGPGVGITRADILEGVPA